MKKAYLLTPGPTPVPPTVLAKEALPILHHRTDEFGAIFTEVMNDLKYVFQTQHDVLLLTTSGTGAMESAVVNLLSPGDTALVATSGVFGDRWVKLLQTYGVQTVILREPDGEVAVPSKVADALKQNPAIKVVFATLTETSTGVVNDIQALGKIVSQTPAVLVVDAISGLGGQDLQMDAWNVDVVVTGSQKGLMVAPGLAMAAVSPKAWALVQNSKMPRFYMDWVKMKKALADKGTPFTPAVSLIVSLGEALKQIKTEGLQNVLARHAWLASATRAAVQALGFSLFAKVPCNVLTSVDVAAKGIDGKQIVKRMRTDYGVSIAGGQADMKGKIIRMAHMGYMDRFDVIVGISGFEMILHELGYPVELGKGVAAAEKAFVAAKIQSKTNNLVGAAK